MFSSLLLFYHFFLNILRRPHGLEIYFGIIHSNYIPILFLRYRTNYICNLHILPLSGFFFFLVFLHNHPQSNNNPFPIPATVRSVLLSILHLSVQCVHISHIFSHCIFPVAFFLFLWEIHPRRFLLYLTSPAPPGCIRNRSLLLSPLHFLLSFTFFYNQTIYGLINPLFITNDLFWKLEVHCPPVCHLV